MTEDEMLLRLKHHVKRVLKLRVPNPDFSETNFYSPQWKIDGSTYYYQLPNKGKIIAIRPRSRDCKFDPDGFIPMQLISD